MVRASQPVKERQFSLCESWRFSRIKEEIGQKNKEIRAAPLIMYNKLRKLKIA